MIPKLSKKDHDLIDSIRKNFPHHTYSDVIAVFHDKTGRVITKADVYLSKKGWPDKAKKKTKKVKTSEEQVDKQLVVPELPPENPKFLNDYLRSKLCELIESKPDSSNAQISRLFLRLTGRKIGRALVCYFRNHKMQPTGLKANGFRLSDAQKILLRDLIDEAEGEATQLEIAESFESITGRSITQSAISYFMVKKLGMPKTGRGQYKAKRGSYKEKQSISIDKHSMEKMENHKPVNSPRETSRGKYHGSES